MSNHMDDVLLFQSLPQTPQSGKSFSALLNGGAPGEHSSSVESVPESGSHPDHVSELCYTLNNARDERFLQFPSEFSTLKSSCVEFSKAIHRARRMHVV
jgi:hypothetical protein